MRNLRGNRSLTVAAPLLRLQSRDREGAVAANKRRPSIVTVGGFLGAGKTSLILAAARVLARRGMRCAAILNDQGGALVDTQLAREQSVDAGEVTGGCFCCRFPDLTAAAGQLAARQPDVIFAEPVGSCTDIAATVLRPLTSLYGGQYRVAPFTVLVDSARAGALAEGSDLEYLFRKQIEEADLVCLTKADVNREDALPGVQPAFRLSARTSEGVAEWLAAVLADAAPGGARQVAVDYTRYGQAEAALAWLNCDGRYMAMPPVSPAMAIGPLLDAVDAALARAGVEVAHLKLLDHSAGGYLKAAICRTGQEPEVEGDLAAAPAREHEMVLNARAVGDPDALRTIVERALDAMPGRWRDRRIECFRPAPPRPVHREPR